MMKWLTVKLKLTSCVYKWKEVSVFMLRWTWNVQMYEPRSLVIIIILIINEKPRESINCLHLFMAKLDYIQSGRKYHAWQNKTEKLSVNLSALALTEVGFLFYFFLIWGLFLVISKRSEALHWSFEYFEAVSHTATSAVIFRGTDSFPSGY